MEGVSIAEVHATQQSELSNQSLNQSVSHILRVF